MRRACLLAPAARIGAADLQLPPSQTGAGGAVREPDRLEIETALARAAGVVAQAARELGLTRQSLYRRMEKLGIAGNDQETR